MSVKKLVPLRGDGPDHDAATAYSLVDIRDGDGKLIKQVNSATADRIIELGGKPLYDSRWRLVRVTVDLNRRSNDASRTTIGNLPATSGEGYPFRRSTATRHGQLAAGKRTNRNVQNDVIYHDRCGLWNVPLPRSDKR